jgi:hypothetical protein
LKNKRREGKKEFEVQNSSELDAKVQKLKTDQRLFNKEMSINATSHGNRV